MNTPDPYTDQADALARHVARAHADHQARNDTGTPTPQAALDLLAAWYAAPRQACEHLNPHHPQPVFGYLADPGRAYCQTCARIAAQVDAALGGTCDLCRTAPAVHGLTYPLGQVGHLLGQCCDHCLTDAEASA